VEENRRLRNLLKAYGVSEAEIDGASGQQGPFAADVLEIMATSRQPCGPGDGCQPVVDPTQQLQPAPYVPTQPTPHPVTRQESFVESHSAASTPQYMTQMPSPAMTAECRQPSHSLYSPTNQEPMHFLPQGYGMPGGGQPAHLGGLQNSATGLITPHAHVQYNDHSSCQIAAESIRTFSPTAGYELEQELGCRAPGEDCNVSNQRIFSVIDRYTVGAG
jgi:hypothetical protein